MAAPVYDVHINGVLAADSVSLSVARTIADGALQTGADQTKIKAAGHAPTNDLTTGVPEFFADDLDGDGFDLDGGEYEMSVDIDWGHYKPPTNNQDDDGDVLELGPQLTKHGDILNVAGLSVADTIPEQVDTQRYQASTLAAWADALADVETTVEVGLAPAPRDPPRGEDSEEAPLALYAQIGDSQVVAFAAPVLPALDDDDGEDTEADA